MTIFPPALSPGHEVALRLDTARRVKLSPARAGWLRQAAIKPLIGHVMHGSDLRVLHWLVDQRLVWRNAQSLYEITDFGRRVLAANHSH